MAATPTLPTYNRPWCVFDEKDQFQARFTTLACAVHTVHTRGRESHCYILGPDHEYYTYQEVKQRFPFRALRKLRQPIESLTQ